MSHKHRKPKTTHEVDTHYCKCGNVNKCNVKAIDISGETLKILLDISTEAFVTIANGNYTSDIAGELLRGVERFQVLFVDAYVDALTQALACPDKKCFCEALISSLGNVTAGIHKKVVTLTANALLPIDIERYYNTLVSIYVIEFSLVNCDYVPPPFPGFPQEVVINHNEKNKLKIITDKKVVK
jgi:predicted nucleic-acid-binding Zn-ribbon protein